MEFSATTVRIGRVRLVGCGEPEPQEGHAMAGRGSRESWGLRRDLRWLPEFASESGSADTPKQSTQTRAPSTEPTYNCAGSSENDASSSATRKWLLLTSKSEMLASRALFLIADV